MKKILTILFMAFIFPLVVSADMEVPPIRNYDAIVTNPKGAKAACYFYEEVENLDEVVIEKKLTIPYDTKVEVMYEIRDEATVLYKDMECYYIKLKDIKPYEENYVISDEDKLNKVETALVIGKNGINVYSGPSKIYNNLGTIPYNTQLEFKYAVKGDWYFVNYVWIYVESEDIKGWICTIGGEVVVKIDNLFIIGDSELIDKNNKQLAVIPKFTELTSVYRFSPYSNYFRHFGYYYIIYNDVVGYSPNIYEGVKLDEEHSFVLDFDAELIDNYWSDNEKVIATIPAGTKLVYNIYGSEGDLVIYTSYNGQQGWVCLEGITPEDEGLTEDEEYEDSEIDDEEETTPEPQKPTEEKKKMRGKDFVILCVGGAIVVALTAVVTIILINKNKKKKVKDVVTEVKSVEEATPVEPVVEQTPVEEVKQEEKIEETAK